MFIAMGQAHEQLHKGAAVLLQRAADELAISANEFDQLNNALDRMRLEIQSLRRELVETAQNRDPLTGARNRASLISDLREQHALARRGVQQCGLALRLWPGVAAAAEGAMKTGLFGARAAHRRVDRPDSKVGVAQERSADVI